MSLKLFLLLHYYSFNAGRIYSNTPSFILDMDNVSLLSFIFVGFSRGLSF